ncbi:2-acylglycerol O-acyltransferase 2-A-like [Patiria miniata]|uniref:Acyltransferase n=1 Tax=Patiria miniata TaxID=46514 RepID=A0A913ZGY7_PATMI|nr:2-acylglycerol O-acyltransferase 2-A-like [Patiria miniata]XP_038050285.1 2-acylglycerol O-acyltransferase 2-A-like [Patiria miniata]
MALEFAPLNIPFHRRLETLAVIQWWFTFLFLGLTSCIIFAYLFLFTSYYWVTLLAILWVIYDHKTPSRGGRRSGWLRRWKIWVHMRNFFPIQLVKTADLDPKKNYLLGFHPHGIMGVGAFVNFSTEATGFSERYTGITPYLLTLSGWFNFPVTRDYIMMSGLCDVSRDSIDYLLGQSGPGNAVIIVVGGATESLEAHPHNYAIYLTKRKGFIKKAIQHGACLVPVYSFGETDIFEQVANPEGSFLRNLQTRLTKMIGFAPPMFHGRGIFNYSVGFLPYRRPIYTVVGKPIPVEKSPTPSQEEIDKVHQMYIDSLKELFEENKTKYGVEPHEKLVII